MSNAQHQRPIVLVHGIFGFNQLMLRGAKLADYFRLIPDALRAAGHIVPRPPQLNLSGSIAKRAQDLKNYLTDPANTEVAGKQVHIIAHSMGGLDARYMISKLGMADRVASLTTVGTPHHGSPIADLVVAGTDPIRTRILEHLGVDINGISDLTIGACRQFNQEVVDHPHVRYFSVAGRFKPKHIVGPSLGVLGLSHDIIRKKEGDNDGLVSVKSATFGERQQNWTFLGAWEANHFRLVNWGTDLALTPFELKDDTIIAKHKALVACACA